MGVCASAAEFGMIAPEIGAMLGVSRQAAQSNYAAKTSP